MSIKISSRKAKGRSLQNWIAERLAEIFEVTFDNSNDHSDIKTRTMGCSGTDIIIQNKELYQKFPFCIECKNTEKLNLYSAIEQAKQNTEINRDWLLVAKKNKNKPIVIMDWETFENLIKKTIY